MRVVDQTCLDKLLLNDSISLDDFMVLDKFQMDYHRSGMVGVKASSYAPRLSASHDTISNDYEILKRKVGECFAWSKRAGGNGVYNILVKIVDDKDLNRVDIEFIEKNIKGIVKPIKEFYESWYNG